MKTSFFSIFLLLLFNLNSVAQLPSDFNKIVPPTPEAAAMQRAVKIPVDISTGVPNISIPLFDITSGGITVPVSISYHAGGISIDQIPTSVGLGWSLSAGGAVMRSIRSAADDNTVFKVTQHFVDSVNALALIRPEMQDVLKGNDFSQDDYAYKFLNYAGSFYFDSTAVIHQIMKDELQFQSIAGSPSYFIAKDFAGKTYTFDQTDNSIMQTYRTLVPDRNPSIQGISAWHLSKIEDQNVGQVSFSYESYNNSYTTLNADIFDLKKEFIANAPGPLNQTCSDGYANASYQIYADHAYYGAVIKQIVARDVRADFFYSIDNTATYWQKRLDSITVTSLIDSLVKKRIAFSYGYFAGNNKLKLLTVRRNSVDGKVADENRFDYYENTQYPLPVVGSRSRDMFGFFNGRTNQFLTTSTDTEYPYADADRSTNPNTVHLGSLKRVTYPTGGSSLFIYEPNQKDANTYGGGIRVKEVDEYNPAEGQLNRTIYEYYGLNGLTYTYPVNMAPENRYQSWHRKFWSSSGTSYTQITGENLMIPQGYLYDSVVVRKKGSAYDIMDSYKYMAVLINGNRTAYPLRIWHYKFDAGLQSYIVLQQEGVDYTQLSLPDHAIPLVAPLPSIQKLYSTYPDVTVDCDVHCDGLNSITILNENAMLKNSEYNIVYDGPNTLTNTTRYYYGNTDHLLPTRIVKMTSRDSVVTLIKYPAEMVAAGLDPTGVFQEMLTRHMWGKKAVEEVFDAQANSIGKTVTTYKDSWLSGTPAFIAAEAGQIGSRGGAPETRRQVYSYDQYGNILDYTTEGKHTSIIWDYYSSSPVARVVNAKSTEVAYTGFESSYLGGWSASGGVFNYSAALTGRKSYFLSSGNSIVKAAGNGNDYIVSYWTTGSASITVNGASGVTGAIKNGWTYHEHSLTAPTTITVAGSGTIDELRAYPKGSLMSTFAYSPQNGISENMDPANRLTRYQYDGMQRLLLVSDADNNIVKKIDYHYTQEKGVAIYYNDEQGDNFYSKSCGVNTSAQLYFYKVPAGIYSSTISKDEANKMAMKEVQTAGQAHANSYGICTPTCPSCTGDMWRCINGVCTRGFSVTTSSVYNPTTNKYDCTYHYEWSDGFRSIDYTSQSDTACL